MDTNGFCVNESEIISLILDDATLSRNSFDVIVDETNAIKNVSLVGLRFTDGSPVDVNNLLGLTTLDNVTVDQRLFDLYADAFQTFDAIEGNTVTVVPSPFGVACDFNGDGVCSVGDIDLLMNAGSVDQGIPVDTGSGMFDLNSSRLIDEKDVTTWLSFAATENGFREPYKLGDANLDGTVDAQDLNVVGLNWQTDGNTWSTGDFNGDGIVGPLDLNKVGLAWLSSISPVAPAAVTAPEPSTNGICLIAVLMLALQKRRRSYSL